MAFGIRLAQNNIATEWRREDCYANTVMRPPTESSHSKDRNFSDSRFSGCRSNVSCRN
ncbi:rCG27217 [Rattus norvegicus]|uniref:RCG27217 n=1 Tax=Rattus norvegicus TaxID=10116 RepID=A6HM72_RAT|nr:rCG27217 [Rattus norvegicus]